MFSIILYQSSKNACKKRRRPTFFTHAPNLRSMTICTSVTDNARKRRSTTNVKKTHTKLLKHSRSLFISLREQNNSFKWIMSSPIHRFIEWTNKNALTPRVGAALTLRMPPQCFEKNMMTGQFCFTFCILPNLVPDYTFSPSCKINELHS